MLASVNFGVITKRRPGRPVARPSCYLSLISLSCSPPPPSHPLAPSLSRFHPFSLFPSLFEVPTDTDKRRQASAVNRYLALPRAISVTKLSCLPIFKCGILINRIGEEGQFYRVSVIGIRSVYQLKLEMKLHA